MPTISVYIRKKNMEMLEETSKQSGKSVGSILNELIEKELHGHEDKVIKR